MGDGIDLGRDRRAQKRHRDEDRHMPIAPEERTGQTGGGQMLFLAEIDPPAGEDDDQRRDRNHSRRRRRMIAEQRAEAVKSMHHRQDGFIHFALDGGAFNVNRHLRRTEAGAENGQPDGKQPGGGVEILHTQGREHEADERHCEVLEPSPQAVVGFGDGARHYPEGEQHGELDIAGGQGEGEQTENGQQHLEGEVDVTIGQQSA